MAYYKKVSLGGCPTYPTPIPSYYIVADTKNCLCKEVKGSPGPLPPGTFKTHIECQKSIPNCCAKIGQKCDKSDEKTYGLCCDNPLVQCIQDKDGTEKCLTVPTPAPTPKCSSIGSPCSSSASCCQKFGAKCINGVLLAKSSCSHANMRAGRILL